MISEQAGRVRDMLLRALDWRVATSPKDYATWVAAVREMDDLSTSRSAIQRTSQREAWDEADRTSVKASRELLKALNAVSVVKGQIKREVQEAKNLRTASESALELAQDELNKVRAIAEELFQQDRRYHGLDELTPRRSSPRRAAESLDSDQGADWPEGEIEESDYAGRVDEQSLEGIDESSPYDCLDFAEMEQWDETLGIPERFDETFAIPEHSDAPPGPEGVAPPAVSFSPDAPAPGEAPFSRTTRKPQSLISRSSDVVRGLSVLARVDGGARFSKEWSALATGIAPASATYLQRARQSANEPVLQTGGVSLPPSSQRAVQAAPEVNEDALKDQLAALRRSLEDFRSAQDTPPVAVPTVSTASQPSGPPDWPQQQLTPKAPHTASMNGPDLSAPGYKIVENGNGAGHNGNRAGHNGNGAEYNGNGVAYDGNGVAYDGDGASPVPPEMLLATELSAVQPDGMSAISPRQPEPVLEQPSEVVAPAQPAESDDDAAFEPAPSVYESVTEGFLDPNLLPPPEGPGQTEPASEEHSGQPVAGESPAGVSEPAVSATLSGRLSLVFMPCPDAAKLGTFWEVVEAAAGAGGLADARPLDSGEGFEFLLDSADEQSMLERLKSGIPEAQITSLGDGRLSIEWSGAQGQRSVEPSRDLDALSGPQPVPAVAAPVQPVPAEEQPVPAQTPLDISHVSQASGGQPAGMRDEAGPAATGDLPSTFSGRLSVVFMPCPDAEKLGSFWETLDEVAGVGAIVDARPEDAGSGFEFVLDLGEGQMSVEELKGRIAHTDMAMQGDAELIIRW